jgi:hypothetical protein
MSRTLPAAPIVASRANRGSMLLENLNPEQNERYITWRRVRLKKEHVRRVRSRQSPVACADDPACQSHPVAIRHL